MPTDGRDAGSDLGDDAQPRPQRHPRSQGVADRYEAGLAVRRRVHGAAPVDRATAAATPLDAPFQRMITEGAWGTVWAGGRFTDRERSVVTLALLAALGQQEELALPVRAAANTGASPEDIAEAMMHVAVYAGVPAANAAFRPVKATLAEMEREA